DAVVVEVGLDARPFLGRDKSPEEPMIEEAHTEVPTDAVEDAVADDDADDTHRQDEPARGTGLGGGPEAGPDDGQFFRDRHAHSRREQREKSSDEGKQMLIIEHGAALPSSARVSPGRCQIPGVPVVGVRDWWNAARRVPWTVCR